MSLAIAAEPALCPGGRLFHWYRPFRTLKHLADEGPLEILYLPNVLRSAGFTDGQQPPVRGRDCMPDFGTAGMEQDSSFTVQCDIQQCALPWLVMPRNQEAPAVRGPARAHQSVPSLDNQITSLTRRGGAKLDRFLVRMIRHNGPLRTIGGQSPIALGVDLRVTYASPAPHVEAECFPSAFTSGTVQADRRWQARTLHVVDAYVLEYQARNSATYGDSENRGRSFGTAR